MSEQRLIDANALLDILSDLPLIDGIRVANVVECLPTVDPVQHGKWIEKHFTWYCSLCNAHPYTGFIPEVPDYNYCPNCGAKMDKE